MEYTSQSPSKTAENAGPSVTLSLPSTLETDHDGFAPVGVFHSIATYCESALTSVVVIEPYVCGGGVNVVVAPVRSSHTETGVPGVPDD